MYYRKKFRFRLTCGHAFLHEKPVDLLTLEEKKVILDALHYCKVCLGYRRADPKKAKKLLTEE